MKPVPVVPTPVKHVPVIPTPEQPVPVVQTPVKPVPVIPTPVKHVSVIPTPEQPVPVVSIPEKPLPVLEGDLMEIEVEEEIVVNVEQEEVALVESEVEEPVGEEVEVIEPQTMVSEPAPVEEVQLIDHPPEAEFVEQPEVTENETRVNEEMFADIDEVVLTESETEERVEQPDQVVPVEDLQLVQSPPEPEIVERPPEEMDSVVEVTEFFVFVEESVLIESEGEASAHEEEPQPVVPQIVEPVGELPAPVEHVEVVETLPEQEIATAQPETGQVVVNEETFVVVEEAALVESESEEHAEEVPEDATPMIASVVEPVVPSEVEQLAESPVQPEFTASQPSVVEEIEVEEEKFIYVEELIELSESEPEAFEETPDQVVPVTVEPVTGPPAPVEDVLVVEHVPEPEFTESREEFETVFEVEGSVAYVHYEQVLLLESESEESVIEVAEAVIPVIQLPEVVEPAFPVEQVEVVQSAPVPEVTSSPPTSVVEAVEVEELFVYFEQEERLVESESEELVEVVPEEAIHQTVEPVAEAATEHLEAVERTFEPEMVSQEPAVSESEAVDEVFVAEHRERDVVVVSEPEEPVEEFYQQVHVPNPFPLNDVVQEFVPEAPTVDVPETFVSVIQVSEYLVYVDHEVVEDFPVFQEEVRLEESEETQEVVPEAVVPVTVLPIIDSPPEVETCEQHFVETLIEVNEFYFSVEQEIDLSEAEEAPEQVYSVSVPVDQVPVPVEESAVVESLPEPEISVCQPAVSEIEISETEKLLFGLQETVDLIESEGVETEAESMEEEPELIVPVTMEPVEQPPRPVEQVHFVQSAPEPDIFEFESPLIETTIALEEHFLYIEEAMELVASEQEEPVEEIPAIAVAVAEAPHPVQAVHVVESIHVPEVFISTPVVTETAVVGEYYAQQQETTLVASESEQQVTVAPKPLIPQMVESQSPPLQMVREVESAPVPDVVEDTPEVESEIEVTELLLVRIEEEEVVADVDVESPPEEEKEVVAVEQPEAVVTVQPEEEQPEEKQPEEEQPEEVVYVEGQIESRAAQLVVFLDQTARTASMATIPKPEKPEVVEQLTVPEVKVEEAQPVQPTEAVEVPEMAPAEERSEQPIEHVVESHVSQPAEDVAPAVASQQVEQVSDAVVTTQRLEEFVPLKRKMVVPPETVEVTKKRKMLVEADHFGQSYEHVEQIGPLPVEQIELEESPVEPVIAEQVEQVPVEDRPVQQIEKVPVETTEVEEVEEVVVEEEEIQVEEFDYEETDEEVELEQQTETLTVRHSKNESNSIELILIFAG